MENFSSEIFDTIVDYFSEDKDILKDGLLYLYKTTNDDKLKRKIVEWFNKENYCISCGEKMVYYKWYEKHNELDDNAKEHFYSYDCPNCGDLNDKYIREDI